MDFIRKFDYHNKKYELVSYSVNEYNLSVVIDAYPAKAQTKPKHDWRSAYRNLLVNGDGMLRVEATGDERYNTIYPPYSYKDKWVNQNDIKLIGIHDINQDGSPELIITARSPYHQAVYGSMMQIYSYNPGDQLPKLMFHKARYNNALKDSGLHLGNSQMIWEQHIDTVFLYDIFDINGDTITPSKSIRNSDIKIINSKYEYIDLIITDKNNNKTPISDAEYHALRVRNLNEMLKFDEFMLPYNTENINKILK